LNNDVSSNEEFNSPSSEDSDGQQNNASIDNLSIDFEDISSDWEDDFNDIEDFNFDEFGADVQLDITDEATPYDVFIMIWDDEVMQLILNSSNKYGEKLKKLKRPHTKNCRIQHFKEISLIELQKFFGLCLLRAELGIPVLRQCFRKDPLNYHPIFSFTMSGRRFEQILGALNCSEGVAVEVNDRLVKISPLFNMIIKKFQSSYSPSKNLSLDESMMLWRGRLIFRQYIKNKRHKYGIKFYELCTPDGYVLSAEIYKGKNIENTSSSKVNDLVIRLMKPFLNKGHHLFMDNFYNSVGLSKILLENKTHTTGTLRSNRKLNPKQITGKNIRLKKGDHIFKRKGPIYVSRWKDKRDIFTITTGYQPQMVTIKNRRGIEIQKPKQIIEYNSNMSGIDRCDQMLSYYSSPRKTIKWYKKVMFHLLDMALWNSFYIYKKKFPQYKGHFIDYHREIVTKLIHLPTDITNGHQLIKKDKGKSSTNSNIPSHSQEKIPLPEGSMSILHFIIINYVFYFA